MTEAAKDSAAACAAAVLIHYSFDLGGNQVQELVDRWLDRYPANWVRLAAIEALYQGRYKAVSIGHILASWNRRHQPFYHFNHEFERLVCSKFPQSWWGPSQASDFPGADRSAIAGSPSSPSQQPPSVPASLQWIEIEDEDDLLGDLWRDPPPTPTSGATGEGDREAATFAKGLQKGQEHRLASVDRHSWEQWSEGDRPNLSPGEGTTSPIHQFTPTVQISDFHSKLKAVAGYAIAPERSRPDSPLEDDSPPPSPTDRDSVGWE
ncbi:MAG: hypothetical protein D6680_13180 [Cyanobacteria bacterium J007]|nr:MAG: hypothetical protein D6680_13180 [Cyanobacteria bacterium J007]